MQLPIQNEKAGAVEELRDEKLQLEAVKKFMKADGATDKEALSSLESKEKQIDEDIQSLEKKLQS